MSWIRNTAPRGPARRPRPHLSAAVRVRRPRHQGPAGGDLSAR
jgi:hypothetical protein